MSEEIDLKDSFYIMKLEIAIRIETDRDSLLSASSREVSALLTKEVASFKGGVSGFFFLHAFSLLYSIFEFTCQ